MKNYRFPIPQFSCYHCILIYYIYRDISQTKPSLSLSIKREHWKLISLHPLSPTSIILFYWLDCVTFLFIISYANMRSEGMNLCAYLVLLLLWRSVILHSEPQRIWTIFSSFQGWTGGQGGDKRGGAQQFVREILSVRIRVYISFFSITIIQGYSNRWEHILRFLSVCSYIYLSVFMSNVNLSTYLSIFVLMSFCLSVHIPVNLSTYL